MEGGSKTVAYTLKRMYIMGGPQIAEVCLPRVSNRCPKWRMPSLELISCKEACTIGFKDVECI